MNFFKKLFGKKKEKEEDEDDDTKFAREEYERDYELKSAGLEKVLGPGHNMVGHALIPFDLGGSVDMYYYPNGIKGTGLATMELIRPDGTGPIPNRLGTYELVAFTKHDYASSEGDNPFNLIERRMCGILTAVGNFSFDEKLKPGDTCDVPRENGPKTCLVFDEYIPEGKEFFIGSRKHGLLLVMEIFPEEMEYARANGSSGLLEKLKEKGYYPYSDMDRESVV